MTVEGCSAVNDHISAKTQPMKVQPSSKFSATIAPLLRFFHPINDGRK